MGLLVFLNPSTLSAETPTTVGSVQSSQVGSASKYHDQVDFIQQFLLNHSSSHNSTEPSGLRKPSNLKSARNNDPITEHSLLSDNNTSPNEIQVIPVKSVPAAISSVIDTLPVHPRIPRRSQVRRNRQHRHSTRVDPVLPVLYLLPPFENEVNLDVVSTTISPTNTIPRFISSSTTVITATPSMTEAASGPSGPLQVESKHDQSDSTQIISAPQYRKVFIPPPLRYLLPPFFYENYVSSQSQMTLMPETESTSPSTLSPFIHDYYSPVQSDFNQQVVETPSLAPIVVTDIVSEPDESIGNWNHQNKHSNCTLASTDNSKSEVEKEFEEIKSHSESNYPQQIDVLSSTARIVQSRHLPLVDSPTDRNQDHTLNNVGDFMKAYSTSSVRHPPQRQFSTKVDQQNSRSKVSRFRDHNTTFENYLTRTSNPPSSTTSPFPVLRGPNIEQVLFETGNFQSFDMPVSDSNDSTVSMMNRPLLAQEVAEAGMKITTSLKKDRMSKAKLGRGNLKYNHLNQFNFDDHDSSKHRGETSQLSVAETSYYNRRETQHRTHETAIPGRPGKDYPTLSQPPEGSMFSCRSVAHHRGYVADPSTGCQVFYICVGNSLGEAMLCPNGTLFSQDFLVCDWWYNVDCQQYT